MEHSSASWDEYQSQRQFNQDPRNFHPTPVPMSGASDKARFYLEQTVPELQELKRKQIFTENEISIIVKKRSDFEHKLNARGSHPSDYAQYAEWEMNLETLRRMRVKRLKVKVTAYSGQRRVFSVLERATRKFHGDLGLWMQYINYARKEKANRKVLKILEAVLRLHPTKPELWIYAAKYATDVQGNMTGARTYMQQALIFCRPSKELWLEYAKLEMIYIAKIVGRRRVLGLDGNHSRAAPATPEEESNADVIALPKTAAEDSAEKEKHDPTNLLALPDLKSLPALDGAIPKAVFEAAMKRFPRDGGLAQQFFDMFGAFSNTPCSSILLQHVLDAMLAFAPTASSTLSCYFRQPVVGVEVTTAEFAVGLQSSLRRLQSSLETATNPAELAEFTIDWLVTILRLDTLDESIRKALSLVLQRTVRRHQGIVQLPGNLKPKQEHAVQLSQKLHGIGFHEEAQILCPEDPCQELGGRPGTHQRR